MDRSSPIDFRSPEIPQVPLMEVLGHDAEPKEIDREENRNDDQIDDD
jgi:hypothetical protein